MKLQDCALALLLATGMAFAAVPQDSGAKQDMKNAGQDTKAAAQNTGSATKKTAKKTGRAAKKATNKGAQKTKQGAQKLPRTRRSQIRRKVSSGLQLAEVTADTQSIA